jgi:hypothetical protein
MRSLALVVIDWGAAGLGTTLTRLSFTGPPQQTIKKGEDLALSSFNL